MRKKKISEREIELRKNPINVFTCCGQSFKHAEFQVHLSDVHKLTKEQFKGKKSMLAHIDGDFWYSYSYQWEFEGGLKFTQYIEQARADDDMMRYAD